VSFNYTAKGTPKLKDGSFDKELMISSTTVQSRQT